MNVGRRWMLRGMVALAAGLGAMFVAPPAASAFSCTTPPSIGTCPPFTQQTCDDACRQAGLDGGDCFQGSGCCNCFG